MDAQTADLTQWTPGNISLHANMLGSLKLEELLAWRSTLPLTARNLLDSSWGWLNNAHIPPAGDWHSWLFLGGRGSGKTGAGADWIAAKAMKGARLALVGASLHDVREVMIDGPSGLRTLAEDGERPRYEASRRRLVWPGGGVAYAFSAEDPESLRGPQFHYAWADEFCAWKAPSETLALLRMGLRLGKQPQLCVTTTPKPLAALRTLLKEAGVVVTRARTAQNIMLPRAFVDSVNALYGGTRLAAQELDGTIVEGTRSLWRAEDLDAAYGVAPERFDEVVVAVDPPAGVKGSACGIIVAGRAGGRAYVLEDATVVGEKPLGWAKRAVAVAQAYGASRIVAEANQGGDMVQSVLAMAGCEVRIELVHARLGKRARAEPVAALYEQGRVRHAPAKGGRFCALEEEMMALGADDVSHSPDRADALVWAVTALLINGRAEPRLRVL